MLRAQSRKYYFLSEEADEKGDMSQRCQDLQHQVGCVQIHVSQLVARGACLDWALASWAVSLFLNKGILKCAYMFIERKCWFCRTQFNHFNNLLSRPDRKRASVFIFSE